MEWDTTTVPNGRYVVRVTATDSPSNPESLALSSEKESDPFDVDNTPPTVSLILFPPSTVRVVVQDDGFYRCYLAGATEEESQLFATSLDELLAPLASPRYIIPRTVVPDRPRSALGVLSTAVRWAVRGRLDGPVVYHAVPSCLAANRARVEIFERAWRRYVSPGRALYAQDPRAQAVLEVVRGENPFEATSQLRTMWQ